MRVLSIFRRIKSAITGAAANKRLRQLVIGACLAAGVFAAYERGLGVMEILEYKSLDLRFKIRGPIRKRSRSSSSTSIRTLSMSWIFHFHGRAPFMRNL